MTQPLIVFDRLVAPSEQVYSSVLEVLWLEVAQLVF